MPHCLTSGATHATRATRYIVVRTTSGAGDTCKPVIRVFSGSQLDSTVGLSLSMLNGHPNSQHTRLYFNGNVC